MKKRQNDELFKAAIGGPEQWQSFAGRLSANQLAAFRTVPSSPLVDTYVWCWAGRKKKVAKLQ
jgi:hypothetical protein